MVLAGYLLLFPPLFLLGPLAALLAASRPASWREWAWIGAAGLWLGLSLWSPGGLAAQSVNAWALCVTAAFVVLMLPGRRRLVPGAFLAAGLGFGLTTVWARVLGTRWQDIRLAVAHSGWEWCRRLVAGTVPAPGSGEPGVERLMGLRVYVNAMAEAVGWLADLYPALLVLALLPGLALAWAWYHRLASAPAGSAPPRFADFRFSDHLIWAVVLAGALLVLPVRLPPVTAWAVENLALVLAGVYAARGAAVLAGWLNGFPPLVLVVMTVGVLLVLPVVLGTCCALGLADTWVDFRRRFGPADSRRE